MMMFARVRGGRSGGGRVWIWGASPAIWLWSALRSRTGARGRRRRRRWLGRGAASEPAMSDHARRGGRTALATIVSAMPRPMPGGQDSASSKPRIPPDSRMSSSARMGPRGRRRTISAAAPSARRRGEAFGRILNRLQASGRTRRLIPSARATRRAWVRNGASMRSQSKPPATARAANIAKRADEGGSRRNGDNSANGSDFARRQERLAVARVAERFEYRLVDNLIGVSAGVHLRAEPGAFVEESARSQALDFIFGRRFAARGRVVVVVVRREGGERGGRRGHVGVGARCLRES